MTSSPLLQAVLNFRTLVLLVVALVAWCVDATKIQCDKDADCVQSTCCKATTCLPIEQAIPCQVGEKCSSCEPFTLDCGGSCFCTDLKQCAARLNSKASGGSAMTPAAPAAGGGDGKKRKMKTKH